jgi:hypothetical protein
MSGAPFKDIAKNLTVLRDNQESNFKLVRQKGGLKKNPSKLEGE